MNTNKETGFTLIELMIVVVIVAILTAVAVPAYQQYVIKANRVEYQKEVLKLASLQENFFLSNNRYADDIIELGYDTYAYVLPSGNYKVYSYDYDDDGTRVVELRAIAMSGYREIDKECYEVSYYVRTGRVRSRSYGSGYHSPNDDPCWP